MEEIVEFTRAVARAAGDIIRENYGLSSTVTFKGAVDPVTATDTAAESLIRARLEEAFPHHEILGEEEGGSHWSFAGPLWLVDPLDGTNNYAHDIPHVSVSLALKEEGEIVVGVVHDPFRDETFAAYRGGGATLNGAPIRVSTTETLAAAFLATGFPYDRRVAADNNTRMLDYFVRRSQGVRRMGSAALDMGYIACGRFDGFWEPRLHPWDLAAGVLIVEEAGGRYSDFSGTQERLFSGEEVVVSNGLIHEEMLRVLREGADAPHPDYDG